MHARGCRAVVEHTPLEVDTAYHEAAHAVAHIVLGHTLHSVSRLPPQPGKLGGTQGSVLPESLKSETAWGRHEFTPDEIEAVKDDITILLIGDIAEAKLRGGSRRFDADNPMNSDEREVVGRMTAVWRGSAATADTEAAALADRARALVEEHWPYIERVAQELLTRGAVSGRTVRVLGWPWPLRWVVRFRG